MRLVTVGGHFRIIGKRRTSSLFVFCPFSREKKLAQTQKSVLNMARSDSQIDKLQRGRPKRAEQPDVDINTGGQSINTERTSLNMNFAKTGTLFNNNVYSSRAFI